jgi:hypothetical protein
VSNATPRPARTFWFTWQGTLVLLLLAVLPFLPSLRDPFFSDDYLHVERLQLVRPGTWLLALRSWILRADDTSAWWTPKDLAIPYFRPLVTLSFLFDHSLWDMRPFGYHLTNLLLHLLTTLLSLGIARRVLTTPFAAWAAAALFALHPCHTEAVSWISGRTDLLAGIFFAGALYCHLRSRGRALSRWGETPHTPRLGRSLWHLGVLVCFLLAICAKEMALTLPLVLLVHNLLYPGSGSLREPLGRRLVMPLLLLCMAGLYVALRAVLLGRGVPPHPFAHGPGDPDMPRQVLMALPLYLADLVLFVPAEPMLTFPFWVRHIMLFLVFCALALLVLRDSLRHSADRTASRFAVLWVLITLLPVLPVTVGERFLYLPSLGYVLLVGAKLPEVPCPAWRGLLLAGVVFAVVAGKGLYFSALSHRSRQAIDEAVAAVDGAPQARQVLLVDLPAASALAFAHAIRLERPARHLDVEVLSIAPHFLSPAQDFRSSVQVSEGGLVIRSEGRPYLSSYIEQAYLAEHPPLRPGEVIERPGYSITVLQTGGADLQAFAVSFPQDETGAAERLILRGHGFHLRPL